jgi:hypothetical protein
MSPCPSSFIMKLRCHSYIIVVHYCNVLYCPHCVWLFSDLCHAAITVHFSSITSYNRLWWAVQTLSAKVQCTVTKHFIFHHHGIIVGTCKCRPHCMWSSHCWSQLLCRCMSMPLNPTVVKYYFLSWMYSSSWIAHPFWGSDMSLSYYI